MEAKLYVIPGSHPANAAQLMLEYKGIDYHRVDLMPIIAKAYLRLHGFPGITVPALKIDGRKIQRSLNISHELERIKPLPALFPQDKEELAKVEEAERWGDEELQPIPRKLLVWCLRREPSAMASFAEGARLGIPTGLALKTAGPMSAIMARFNGVTDEAARANLDRLPGAIDHIDSLIKEGVIGGEEPNAADFQIAASVRLLLCLEDLRTFFMGRPAKDLAMRVQPDMSGNIGSVIPSEWLEPINAVSSRS